ncbi:MAG: DUF4139 domain-containing protein [Polyangiaceae bacterium]|nr:DUF4139 domain-containing protein [Polyangiaceae bacterium]
MALAVFLQWGGEALAQPSAPRAQGGAARAPDRAAAALPLRTVRLYEAGLGYFERTGRLGKGSDLTLPVPTSHLDDALKTLVVLAADGKASVAGVEFASSVSPEMGRALAGLPAQDDTITYPKLLRSLQGASVELRTERESLRGRLIETIEPSQSDMTECAEVQGPAGGDRHAPPGGAAAACAAARQMTLLVLTDRGEVRRLRAAEVTAIRPTDPGFAARIGSGLDAISAQGAAVQKQLRVLATGTSEVTLGYVAEAPVWRSSYRLLLDDKAKGGGVLQGWALVHNDTDEDWKKVNVELVNGQPASFLVPLAAPRYGRREIVTPKNQLSTVPQLLGRTVDSMWGDEIGESFGAGGFGLSGVGQGGGGRGEGIGLGTIGTVGHGAGTGASTALSVGNLAAIAPAEGVEAGALFRYTLPSPIDLRAHGSALVPFVQRAFSARRIAYFDHPGDPARSAARIKNDTGQTLPEGTIAFFADGGFAGEGTLDRMTPGEQRIVSFGVDLDVELTVKSETVKDETRLVVFERDALVEHFVRRRAIEYDLVNRSSSGRTVFLTLHYVTNARVTGADELDFDTTAGKAQAVFSVEGRAQRARKLDVEEGLSRRHPVAGLDARALDALAAEAKLSPDQRGLLRAAAKQRRDAAQRGEALAKVAAATAEAQGDLTRLRAHLAAARQGSDEAEPFVERILAAEDTLKSLRARAAKLTAERDALSAAAVATLARLAPPGK